MRLGNLDHSDINACKLPRQRSLASERTSALIREVRDRVAGASAASAVNGPGTRTVVANSYPPQYGGIADLAARCRPGLMLP